MTIKIVRRSIYILPRFLFSLTLFAILGCAMQNPSEKATKTAPVASVSSTVIPTPARRFTPTTEIVPTETPTPVPLFGGSWDIWTISDDVIYQGSGGFEVAGQAISGFFILFPGGYNYTFTGTVDSSGQTAEGDWNLLNGGFGTFFWQIRSGNTNQFVGNLDSGHFPFCGARSGGPMPRPCQWP